MYFSKICLRKDAGSLKKLNQYIHKNGYYYHQLIWGLFSDEDTTKKRDFIYRAEFDSAWPNFYVVSATEPVDRKGIWSIQSKIYQPKIKNKDSFYFMLQVNPRVCRKNDKGNHQYFDVVQDAFHRLNREKSKSEIIQEVGEKWLDSRGEKNGFIVTPGSVMADNFQKHHFKKSKQANIISFSTIDFRGQLQVINTEKFMHALYHGMGAAKGFGCGLLMVKR